MLSVTSMGCYNDVSSRILSDKEFLTLSDNTPMSCARRCLAASQAFVYSGTEIGNQCFCSATEPDPSKVYSILNVSNIEYITLFQATNPSDCSRPCSGDSSLICGETWKISVYKSTVYYGILLFSNIYIFIALTVPLTVTDPIPLSYKSPWIVQSSSFEAPDTVASFAVDGTYSPSGTTHIFKSALGDPFPWVQGR